MKVEIISNYTDICTIICMVQTNICKEIRCKISVIIGYMLNTHFFIFKKMYIKPLL